MGDNKLWRAGPEADPSNTWWGDLLLASLRGASTLIIEDDLNPQGYQLRGDALLAAAQILRRRHPDNLEPARECLAAAERALLRAEERALQENGLPLLHIQCLLAQVLLYRSRLHDDDTVAIQVARQLAGPIAALRKMLASQTSAPQAAGALATAYVIQSWVHAGRLMDFPAETNLQEARKMLRRAHTIITGHSPGTPPSTILVDVWLARAMLEAYAGDVKRMERYARGMLTIADEISEHVQIPIAVAYALLEDGLVGVDALMLSRFASMPDDVHVGL